VVAVHHPSRDRPEASLTIASMLHPALSLTEGHGLVDAASCIPVGIWGVYSDKHGEVDLGGDRDSLRELGEKITRGLAGDVHLGEPPADWLLEGRPLQAIRLDPSDDPADLILLRRDGPTLVISGQRSELARIVGSGILDLSGAPYRVTANSVPTHLHIDPTTDPEGRWFSSESTASFVVHIAAENGA
jgi:hypothetical protein